MAALISDMNAHPCQSVTRRGQREAVGVRRVEEEEMSTLAVPEPRRAMTLHIEGALTEDGSHQVNRDRMTLVFLRLINSDGGRAVIDRPASARRQACHHLAPRADDVQFIDGILILVFSCCSSFGEAVHRAESALCALRDAWGEFDSDFGITVDVITDQKDGSQGIDELARSLPMLARVRTFG